MVVVVLRGVGMVVRSSPTQINLVQWQTDRYVDPAKYTTPPAVQCQCVVAGWLMISYNRIQCLL